MLPLLYASILSGCAPTCPESAYDEDAMRADVVWLSSVWLGGRVPGTAGDGSAAGLVAGRFECLGLDSVGDAYELPFTDAEGRETANVIAWIPGADESVGDEVVVLSAHIDHLGEGRLGANDNASGVAGLLAVAQAMSEGEPPARSVVFAGFGSEESGFEGAANFLDDLPAAIDAERVVYNVNLDMIGTYDNTDIVYALGTLPGTEGRVAVDSLARSYPELQVGVGDASDMSDNYEFCTRGVPYVFFWTEDLDCYHETCDTADRIDTQAMAEIARLTGDLTSWLADTDADLLGAVRPGEDVCGMEEG